MNNMNNMKNTYKVEFLGRKVGAIGVFYPITAYVVGENKEDCISNLYRSYEPYFYKFKISLLVKGVYIGV